MGTVAVTRTGALGALAGATSCDERSGVAVVPSLVGTEAGAVAAGVDGGGTGASTQAGGAGSFERRRSARTV